MVEAVRLIIKDTYIRDLTDITLNLKNADLKVIHGVNPASLNNITALIKLKLQILDLYYC